MHSSLSKESHFHICKVLLYLGPLSLCTVTCASGLECRNSSFLIGLKKKKEFKVEKPEVKASKLVRRLKEIVQVTDPNLCMSLTIQTRAA